MTKKIIVTAASILFVGASLLFISFTLMSLFHLKSAEETKIWLDFISAIVAGLAWPVAIILLALSFRKQIELLLISAETLEFLGVKWSRQLAAAVETLKENDIGTDTVPAPEPAAAVGNEVQPPQSLPSDSVDVIGATEELDSDKNISDIALRKKLSSLYSRGIKSEQNKYSIDSIFIPSNPTGAVIVAWRRLTDTASKLAMRIDRKAFRSPAISDFDVLHFSGIITDAELQTVFEIRSLRNEAAHLANKIITNDDASKYVALTNVLINRWTERFLKYDGTNPEKP